MASGPTAAVSAAAAPASPGSLFLASRPLLPLVGANPSAGVPPASSNTARSIAPHAAVPAEPSRAMHVNVHGAEHAAPSSVWAAYGANPSVAYGALHAATYGLYLQRRTPPPAAYPPASYNAPPPATYPSAAYNELPTVPHSAPPESYVVPTSAVVPYSTASPIYGGYQPASQITSPYGASPAPYRPSAAAPSTDLIHLSPVPGGGPHQGYYTLHLPDHVVAAAPFYFAHLIPVKLTTDNYLSRRAQVLPLLHSRNLEGFVDGTLLCPPPCHPGHHVWVAQDQAILFAIQSSLTEGVSSLVIFVAASRDAWTALHTSFASQSQARAHAIRTALGDVKLQDLTVIDYFNKVTGMADTLASIGKVLGPEEFTSYVLNGLRRL
ncbi:uncharacterized protein LOC123443771 [Hordeum vulgare subsp. vulgare]|uniref:uncharacterized protein LOC123443771 n=1 Tax=Hordeum vulgare subsp. vulgare TaxID=112509 RepID=UPI0002955CD7|nr:uncharacterized protein LOC123443771 [Hordeum vulgare subsp. vulgare]